MNGSQNGPVIRYWKNSDLLYKVVVRGNAIIKQLLIKSDLLVMTIILLMKQYNLMILLCNCVLSQQG